jgi:hypothetical protein
VKRSKNQFVEKARGDSLLLNFPVSLHAMAEVGGLKISIKETRFPEMLQTRHIPRGHSTLSACLVNSCSLTGRNLPKWNGWRVVCDHPYVQQRSGGL